jgi:hypothetical protein
VGFHHREPAVVGHVVEETVAEDTCVVYHGVNPAAGIESERRQVAAAGVLAHRVVRGDGTTTGPTDLLDHEVGGAVTASSAVRATAEIVDDHERSPPGELVCVGASETVAGAGDDDNLPVEAQLHDAYTSRSMSIPTRKRETQL